MQRKTKILFCLSALACGCCQKEQAVVEQPAALPASITFAVAPILNFSGKPDLDPIQAADLLASELTSVPGANVIPVNRVMAVLASQGKSQVESPAQAIHVAEAVGADAIIVAAITEYDAYTPVVGLILQMYSVAPARNQSLDAVAASRMSRPFEAPRMASSYAPSAQVQGTYNAMHESVVKHIKKYADDRDETDYPQGWRQYLHMQSLYLRFCWSDAIASLMNQDSWKIAMVAPLESDHE